MLYPDPTPTQPGSIPNLKKRVDALTAEHIDKQFREPFRWQELATDITREFEQLLNHNGAECAGSYLTDVHTLCFEAGLRPPCRVALGHLAQLAEQFGLRERFESIAVRELQIPVPFSHIPDSSLQVSLIANELACWNSVHTLIEQDKALSNRLIDTIITLVHEVDCTWRLATQNKLWQIHAASTALGEFGSSSTKLSGTEASMLTCASQYLADFVLPLAENQQLNQAPPESPLRPLEYGTEAALDEYFDLAFRDRHDELSRLISAGDSSAFLQVGLSLSDCVGRLLVRVKDVEKIEACCASFLEVWREWWNQTRMLPPEPASALMAAQARVVARACLPLMLCVKNTTDTHGSHLLSTTVANFLDSPETKRARAPATNIAPIRLLSGRIWERLWDLRKDKGALHHARHEYVEVCRLLLQTPHFQKAIARDALASIDRLPPFDASCDRERGIVCAARGSLSLYSRSHEEALVHFTQAIELLRKTIADPEIEGLKNLTFLTARACSDAAKAAEQLKDSKRSVALLNTAATILEEAALIFKIEAAQLELRRGAQKYRSLAANKDSSSTPDTGNAPGFSRI